MSVISRDIEQASRLLKAGEVVAIPTETVYGLAGNALDRLAVTKIFEVKQRPSFDPLIIHLFDKEQIDKYCDAVPPAFYKLYDVFCPGPITFILSKKSIVPDLVTSGNNTVAVRFPNHPLTRELLGKLDFPLAAPSANPFGYVSPTTAQHVDEQLGNNVPLILDGGPTSVGLESTIIDLSQPQLSILRLGGLAIEEIEEVLGQKIEQVKTSNSNPKAPGMLSSHYSPSKKLIFGDMEANYKTFKGAKLGTLSFQKKINCIPLENQRILSPNGDLREAASNLFKALREMDKMDIEVILAEKFPEEGLGKAINDRLLRASH